MTKEFWTQTEVIEIFGIERQILIFLDQEEILGPCERDPGRERFYTREEMEMIRIATLLMEDFEVNLPGVDIILRMRGQMIAMRKQFDAILADLSEKLRSRL